MFSNDITYVAGRYTSFDWDQLYIHPLKRSVEIDQMHFSPIPANLHLLPYHFPPLIAFSSFSSFYFSLLPYTIFKLIYPIQRAEAETIIVAVKRNAWRPRSSDVKAGGHGAPMSELSCTSVPRRSLCPTVQPETSRFLWAKSTARTTAPTQHVRPGFRRCWSVCLEEPFWPCSQLERHRSCFQAQNIYVQKATKAKAWHLYSATSRVLQLNRCCASHTESAHSLDRTQARDDAIQPYVALVCRLMVSTRVIHVIA